MLDAALTRDALAALIGADDPAPVSTHRIDDETLVVWVDWAAGPSEDGVAAELGDLVEALEGDGYTVNTDEAFLASISQDQEVYLARRVS